MLRGFPTAGLLSLGLMILPVAAAADGMPTTSDGMPASRPIDPYAYRAAPIGLDYNWSGFYLGGHGAGAYSQVDWTFTTPTESLKQTEFAFGGGAQAGLQLQFGSIVIGGEASYTWIDFDQTSPSTLAAGTSRTSQVSNLLLATGKVGVAQDNMLAYAKGGYALADVDFRSSITAGGVVTTTSSGREHGWVGGVGMDYGLTPHIMIGVEYNYIHLNVDPRDQIPTPAGVAGSRTSGGIDIQTIMARLNLRIGPSSQLDGSR